VQEEVDENGQKSWKESKPRDWKKFDRFRILERTLILLFTAENTPSIMLLLF